MKIFLLTLLMSILVACNSTSDSGPGIQAADAGKVNPPDSEGSSTQALKCESGQLPEGYLVKAVCVDDNLLVESFEEEIDCNEGCCNTMEALRQICESKSMKLTNLAKLKTTNKPQSYTYGDGSAFEINDQLIVSLINKAKEK